VDFVRPWSEKTEIGAGRFIRCLDIPASKFYNWRERYGKVNEHNGWVPRDFWLEDWEKQAIIAFHLKNPLEGYRRLTFMMLDADIVAVSPASVWRVLSRAGLLRKWNGKPSKKGTGFEQPPQPHQHWHIDVSYLNVCATFYYLCSILDGYRRFLVHWDLRESMTRPTSRSFWNGPKSGTRVLNRGSFPITDHSLSPRTSRSSFGSRV
jgi:putative transposase